MKITILTKSNQVALTYDAYNIYINKYSNSIIILLNRDYTTYDVESKMYVGFAIENVLSYSIQTFPGEDVPDICQVFETSTSTAKLESASTSSMMDKELDESLYDSLENIDVYTNDYNDELEPLEYND